MYPVPVLEVTNHVAAVAKLRDSRLDQDPKHTSRREAHKLQELPKAHKLKKLHIGMYTYIGM